MRKAELAQVVARIQAGDNRVVDRITLEHWSETIGYLNFNDALEAVVMHFRESTDYLMPAHIIANVRRIRDKRGDLHALPNPETCNHRFIGRDGDCVLCGLIPPQEVTA